MESNKSLMKLVSCSIQEYKFIKWDFYRHFDRSTHCNGIRKGKVNFSYVTILFLLQHYHYCQLVSIHCRVKTSIVCNLFLIQAERILAIPFVSAYCKRIPNGLITNIFLFRLVKIQPPSPDPAAWKNQYITVVCYCYFHQRGHFIHC